MTDFCKTLPTLQRTWSASSLRLLMECPRKYWYRKIRGIRPIQPQDDLDFGSFLHVGMEAYDRFIVEPSGETTDVSVVQNAAVIHALRIMLHTAGTYATAYTCRECGHTFEDVPTERLPSVETPDDCPKCRIDLEQMTKVDISRSWTPWNPDNIKKNRRTLVRALVWTLDEFANSHIQPYSNPDGSAATEVDFAVPLPIENPDGEPYLLTGIIDSFAQVGGPDQIMPRERKTTNATLGKGFFGRYEFDIQVDVYSLAMQIMAAEEITPGIILEAVQTGVTFSRARRQIITPSNDQLAEFVETLRYWIGQAEGFAREAALQGPEPSAGVAHPWPMNRANCNSYRKEDIEDKMYSSLVHGGCPYRELCTKDRSVRSRYEAGSYEVA